jgi:hypothetical protein
LSAELRGADGAAGAAATGASNRVLIERGSVETVDLRRSSSCREGSHQQHMTRCVQA